MLVRSKLAIAAAVFLGVASSTMAAQAQTIVNPYPTEPAVRSYGLPTDPYPFGVQSEAASAPTVAYQGVTGRTYARERVSGRSYARGRVSSRYYARAH